VIARPPVGEILARVIPDDALSLSRDKVRAALETLEASGVPWYLRLLTGIGAWTGGGFLLSFTTGMIAAILGVNNFEGIAIILGLIVLAGAVILRRNVSGTGVGAQFMRQLALVACFCGQMLFIGGAGATTESTEAAAVAALMASAVLIGLYPDRVQRFCSTVIAVGAVGTLLAVIKEMPYCADVMALLMVGGVLFLGRIASREGSDERAEIIEPVMYGLAIALFGLLIVSTAILMFGGGLGADMKEVRAVLIGRPTAFGFVLALLWLTASIFSEHGAQPTAPEAMLAFVAIIAIGWITQSTPAITATMLMLVLGFDRHARALIALSTLFFLMFGTAYYYGLNLTLLQKSGILAASGAFCLMASAFVRYRYRAIEENA
jgi:uncharacterized membrane protein